MSDTGTANAAGQTTAVKSYSSANNPNGPSSVTDGNGRLWSCTYDQYGNVLTETAPKGTTTTFTYSYSNFALGELVSVKEGTKAATQYTYYQPSGLIHEIIRPLPGQVGGTPTNTTTLTYTALGNLAQVSSPGNNSTALTTRTFGYTTDGSYSQAENLGRPIRITDGLGKVTHLRYDARGNLLTTVDALGNTSGSTFNLADQPLTETLPATGATGSGQTTNLNTFLYPGGPWLQSTLCDESANISRVVGRTYGSEGEELSHTGAEESAVVTYDAAYHMKSLTDGGGGTTSYTYDLSGRHVNTLYPGATGTNFDKTSFTSYDAQGNVLSKTTGTGQVVNYEYADTDGFLTKISFVNASQYDVTFTYDAYGRRQTMSDGAGTYSFAYDDMNNLIQESTTYTGLPSQSIGYDFWPDGHRKTVTLPGSNVFQYSYDAAGRCSTFTVQGVGTTGYSYLDNGWLSSRTLPNGASTTYAYNAVGAKTGQISQTSSGGSLSSYGSYAFNGSLRPSSFAATIAGNLTHSGTTSYTFDSKDRLTGESSTRLGSYSQGFGYDGANNPTTFKGQARTYNADNQRTGSGFTYDGAGNPTTYNGVSMGFDPANRLSSVGSSWTAGYRGDLLQAWKQSGTTRKYYLYVDGVRCLELSASGSVLACNAYGPDGLVGRKQAGNWEYFTFDTQGSVSQRLDATGAVLSTATYDAHGAESVSGTAAEFFGYNAQFGYLLDRDTGLYLCQHRYYDPGAGRFINRDPAGAYGGVNLYSHTAQRMVGYADPSGLLIPPFFPPPFIGNPVNIPALIIADGIVCGGLLLIGLLDGLTPEEVCEKCSETVVGSIGAGGLGTIPVGGTIAPGVIGGGSGFIGAGLFPKPWCHPEPDDSTPPWALMPFDPCDPWGWMGRPLAYPPRPYESPTPDMGGGIVHPRPGGTGGVIS